MKEVVNQCECGRKFIGTENDMCGQCGQAVTVNEGTGWAMTVLLCVVCMVGTLAVCYL